MKRSDKYKMTIDLYRPPFRLEMFVSYGDLQPYSLSWKKDNGKFYSILVTIVDIAPPVTPEVVSHIPLDVRYALHEQYGDQIKQDLQNTLDMIDDKEKLEKVFKK